MRPFEYFEPVSVAEAVQLSANYGEKARILAGGLDLLTRIRSGAIDVDYVIGIQRIPGLDYLEWDRRKGLALGAMAKLRALEISDVVRRNYPSLYQAVHQISSIQVKSMGTAVGNLCVATPASDIATVLCSLGAQIKIAGTSVERVEPIESFYLDAGQSSLRLGEMVTEVVVPVLTSGTQTAFLNLVRTHADIAKVSVAVALTIAGGICREARIALGSVAPTVIRAFQAEEGLRSRELTPDVIEAAARTASEETMTISDVRSTAEYRREMARVLVRRAVEKAAQPAGRGSSKEEAQ
jgi:aerobic carbon-monoxide dehydrogenase medium subunit